MRPLFLLALISVLTTGSGYSPTANIEGRLIVAEERAAGDVLSALAREMRATDFTVSRESDETVVRMSVRGYWPRAEMFWKKLRELGCYRPDYEDTDEKTEPVRVLLRLRPTGVFYRCDPPRGPKTQLPGDDEGERPRA